jgi:pyruvate dehydrogenase E1 component alpha subunit
MPIRTLVSYSVELVSVLDEQGIVDPALMPELSVEQIRALYRHMVLTRQLDEKMFTLQRQGRLGTFPRVLGQEGAHVGAAFALRPDDWLVPAFRETGALLRRGIPMAQLLQYWSGDERGGAFPKELNTLPIAIPVGTHMLHAVGIGWGLQDAGRQSAVLTFFGEGATSEGDFSEAMNMAGVFQAPVVFFCQNNQYAISVPYSKQTAAPTVAQKAVGYGMTGIRVDGNDVFAVYKVTSEALERARSGLGPTLIEAYTYRVTDHTTSDDARRYRVDAEVAEWKKRDPIERLGRYMRSVGLLDDTAAADILAEANDEVAKAVEAFEAIPPIEPEELFAHIYAETPPTLVEQRKVLETRSRKGA